MTLLLFKNQYIKEISSAQERSLYDFAYYINGAAFKPNELTDDSCSGLPVIKIAELKSGITASTKYFIGHKDSKYNVQNKDILFSWSGNPDTSIDVFIWYGGDGILNQHTFNVKSRYDCPWFTYLLLKYHKPIFSNIASNKQTTGLGHITAADLKRLTFPFNLKAMRSFESAISSVMDRYFNNMMENLLLARTRDALLPQLMSGKIDVSALDL